MQAALKACVKPALQQQAPNSEPDYIGMPGSASSCLQLGKSELQSEVWHHIVPVNK